MQRLTRRLGLLGMSFALITGLAPISVNSAPDTQASNGASTPQTQPAWAARAEEGAVLAANTTGATPAAAAAPATAPAAAGPATRPQADVRLNFKDVPLDAVLEHLSQA